MRTALWTEREREKGHKSKVEKGKETWGKKPHHFRSPGIYAGQPEITCSTLERLSLYERYKRRSRHEVRGASRVLLRKRLLPRRRSNLGKKSRRSPEGVTSSGMVSHGQGELWKRVPVAHCERPPRMFGYFRG